MCHSTPRFYLGLARESTPLDRGLQGGQDLGTGLLDSPLVPHTQHGPAPPWVLNKHFVDELRETLAVSITRVWAGLFGAVRE